MKSLFFALTTIFAGLIAHAGTPSVAQTKILNALIINPAVAGALENARHWARTGSCRPLQMISASGSEFTAEATCWSEDDDDSSAKVKIQGSAYPSEPGILIRSISFGYKE